MTVSIEIDEKLLTELDQNLLILKQDRETALRDGFINIAAKIKREAEVAQQYRKAYSEHPQTEEEFADWEAIQDWGEDDDLVFSGSLDAEATNSN